MTSRIRRRRRWRQLGATMGSLDAILEYAPGRFIDLVAPRPLLMILAKDDAIAPPDSIREAFDRAGGPKRLLEVEGGHYAVYSGNGAKKRVRLRPSGLPCTSCTARQQQLRQCTSRPWRRQQPGTALSWDGR